MGAFDIFTYHRYCNGQNPVQCAQSQIEIVSSLREVLPPNMPVYLEETGSSAGPYVPFHDTTGEAAFVVPYVAAMSGANLSGAHWWCASDIYTEHSGMNNYTWIPHQDYSGGMPRREFTGRWGFTTPSGVAKPIHRAFQLLRLAGDDRIEVAGMPGDPGDICNSSVQVLALTNGSDKLGSTMVFVSNTGRASCNVTLNMGKWAPHINSSEHNNGSVHDGASSVMLYRIDAEHGNPVGLWESWSSPAFPTPKQVSQLKADSEPNNGLTRTSLSSGGLVELQLGTQALHVVVARI